MNHLECNLKDTTKYSIVKCISDAIGDDVKACLKKEHIDDRKSNAKKFIKWDFINRNFTKNFLSTELTSEYAKRGAWYFVPLFNKETGTLFSIMREDRFNELQKKHFKRIKAHYLDAFVQSFNFDLDQNKQMSLFGTDKFDEKEVKVIVEGILKDFQMDNSVVHRYATILFEEYNSELISIRCCVLDSSLQIVEEESWNEFICYNESVVVDTVEEDSKQKEMPNIKLKDAAIKRIRQNNMVIKEDNTTDEGVENL